MRPGTPGSVHYHAADDLNCAEALQSPSGSSSHPGAPLSPSHCKFSSIWENFHPMGKFSSSPPLAPGGQGSSGNHHREREKGVPFLPARDCVCWGLKTDLPYRQAQSNSKWKTDPWRLESSQPRQPGIKGRRGCPQAPAQCLVIKFALGNVSPAHSPGGKKDLAQPGSTLHREAG